MGMVDAGQGRTHASRKDWAGPDRRTKQTFLSIDKLVDNLAATLTRAGARTVRMVVPDSTVRLKVNPQEMAQAFAMLARLVAGGAAVTILGGSVPIKAGEEREGKGCAFVSISVRAAQPRESGPSGDALAAFGGIIKKHSGSFRLGRQRDEMLFNLYLPVLHAA